MLIGLFGDFRNRHLCVPVTQLIASVLQQAKVWSRDLGEACYVFPGLNPVKFDVPFFFFFFPTDA